MQYKSLFALVLGALSLGNPILAQSASDFLPPAKGGATNIKAPESVKVEQDATLKAKKVVAPTLQDAGLKAQQLTEIGEEVVVFEDKNGGVGFMATASESYNNAIPNPDAIRLSRRQAYVNAFLAAKEKLLVYRQGMSLQAKQSFVRKTGLFVDDAKTTIEEVTKNEESINSNIRGLIEGAVTWRANDNGQTVTVTVYTTNEIARRARSLSASAISAADLESGINMVLDKLKSNVLLPVGGQYIEIPGTNQAAFVGFGSAIVPDMSNPRAKSIVHKKAVTDAQNRAGAALLAMIKGTDLEAANKLAETYFDEFRNTERKSKSVDPEAAKQEEGLQDRASSALKSMTDKDRSAVANGDLPEAANIKTYETPDGWILTVIIYIPHTIAVAPGGAPQGRASNPSTPTIDPTKPGPSGQSGDDPRRRGGNQ